MDSESWRSQFGAQDPDPDDKVSYDLTRLRPLLDRHKVTLACLALIVLSVAWKTLFISHYAFQQDDFQVFDASLHSRLSWSFLTHDDDGHLFPGVYAIAWVLARSALYNWTAASVVSVAMILAASLAAWRVLRTLFGNRPAILIPLTFYLLSPLAFPVYYFWITAIEAIPLQIAVFMSLDSHVRYLRSGRTRDVLAAAGWLLFGLVFFEKAAVIPFLLFAITAGFLVRQPLLRAIRTSVTALWKAWALYLALLVGYAAVLHGAMRAADTQFQRTSASDVATLTSSLLRNTLLPAIFGGPWKWASVSHGTTVISNPPSSLVFVSALAAVVIIGASILVRPRAWRAWAILAGWIVVADILPLAVGRLGFPGAAVFLGLDTRYVFDTAAILAIAIGLAFWPVAESADLPAAEPAEQPAAEPGPWRNYFGGRWRTVALGLTAVFVIGAIWSVTAMQEDSSGSYVRGYLATAQAAMAQVPAGTAIYGSGAVSPDVEIGLFGKSASASVVLKPLSHRGPQLRWLAQPYGTIDDLMAFSQDTGQLYPATIASTYATQAEPLPRTRTCNSPSSGLFTYQFPSRTSIWAATLQLGYLASPVLAGQDMTVMYGNLVRRVPIVAGLHTAWVPVTGVVSQVVVQVATAPPAAPGSKARSSKKRAGKPAPRARTAFDFCVSPTVTAGDIGTSATGSAYPDLPVAGS